MPSPTATRNLVDRYLQEHVDGYVPNSEKRFTLVEYFERKPGLNADIQNAAESTRMIANPNFELLGTNATSDDATLASGGGIQLETDGADNDQVILLPHLDANQTAWSSAAWLSQKEPIFDAIIEPPALIGSTDAASLIWAGLKLTNTPVIATDTDQAFFRFSFDDSDTTWRCISSAAGVDTNADSGVAVSAQRYRLRVELNSSRKPYFYIAAGDGPLNLVAVGAAMATAKTLIPYVGIMQLAGTITPEIKVRRIMCSRLF